MLKLGKTVCGTMLGMSILGVVYYWFQMDLARIVFKNKKIKYFSNSNNKVVLTIDDAPYTRESFSKTLEILNKYNIRATFFVISGFVNSDNENLLVDAIKQGHHLANHGKKNSVHCLLNKNELGEEISDCQNLINNLYKKANIQIPETKYYRPGHGIVNDTISKYCEQYNYEIVLGNIYPLDPIISSSFINRFYIFRHMKGNDILILHDRKHTPEMLDKLFEEMRNMNYVVGNLLD